MFRFFSDFDACVEIYTNSGEKLVKFLIFAKNKNSLFSGYKCYLMLGMYLDIDNNTNIFKNSQF